MLANNQHLKKPRPMCTVSACAALPPAAAAERKQLEEETEVKRQEHKEEQAKLAAQRKAEADARKKKAEEDAAAAAQKAADEAAAQAEAGAAGQEGDGTAPQEVGRGSAKTGCAGKPVVWVSLGVCSPKGTGSDSVPDSAHRPLPAEQQPQHNMRCVSLLPPAAGDR